MIKSSELQKRVLVYRESCIDCQKAPTLSGLAASLGISALTIKHIITGYYKDGNIYTDKPHITRCVANDDFELIRALFEYQ